MEAKPIETAYNGYLFRSRLEARWAVFFDAMKLPYRYEMEGFQLGELRYLPDFWLPEGVRFIDETEIRQDVWVEIKPKPELPDSERQKMAEFVKQTGKSLLLIAGDPGGEATLRFITAKDKRLQAPYVKWVEMSGQRLGLLRLESLDEITDSEARNALAQLTQTQLLTSAYLNARQERFERTNGNYLVDEKGSSRTCEACGMKFLADQPYYRLCPSCYRAQRNGQTEESSSSTTEKSSAAATSSATDRTATLLSPGNRRFMLAGIGVLVLVMLLGVSIIPNAIRAGKSEIGEATPTVLPTQLQPTQSIETDVPPKSTPIAVPTSEIRTNRAADSITDDAPCDCSSNQYNCGDFESPAAAQTCFDFCYATVKDVHKLDGDSDKRVCEPTSTPTP